MDSSPRLTRSTVVAPLLIILGALILRGWQLSERTFYWDDLVIPARFRDTGLWVPYDGHLMPGSAAVQIAVDALAPLQWWLPAVLILVATAAAGALWWLLLGRLTHSPGIRLLGLTAIVFSPFLGIASGWWSAGVNALAWQLTAAGVGLLLLRPTATWWHSLAATAALASGLLMTEKALSVVPALIGVAVILRLRGQRIPALPFLAPAALTAGWVALYLHLSGHVSQSTGPGLDDLTGAVGSAVLPGILGGPWTWDRWNPSPAFATTPVTLRIAVIVIVVTLVVIFLFRTRRRLVAAVGALVVSVGYLAIILLLLQSGRSGDGASDLLARGMHYYVDWWTVTVLALVAVSADELRPRQDTTSSWFSSASNPLPVVMVVAFIVSSVFSTATWVHTWDDDPSRDYLPTLREAADDPDNALLDQNMPLEILTPLVNPYNSAGNVAGSLDGISDITSTPRIITPDGDLVDAHVLDNSHSEQGEEPDCGIRVEQGRPQIIQVDPALPFGDWTWEFNATADQPVNVMLTTPNGLEDESAWRSRAVSVPVETELSSRWVNLSGGGGTIMAEVDGPPGSHVCVGAGAVGPLVPD
jgi:hypothetical protein